MREQHVTHHREEPGLEVCTLTGEIDLTFAPDLLEVLADCEWRQVARLVLDLADVRFLALSVMGLVAEYAERARSAGSRVGLVVPNRPIVTRAVRVCGLSLVMPQYTSLPEALVIESAAATVSGASSGQ